MGPQTPSPDPASTGGGGPSSSAEGPFDLIMLAASAGGVNALGQVLSALPADLPAAVAVILHRPPGQSSILTKILARRTQLRVKEAEEGEPIVAGTVYIAPPDRHLIVNPDRTFSLWEGPRIRHTYSSADPLFATAAAALPGRAIAVVLTGGDADGADGVQAVKGSGGTVIAQDWGTSVAYGMPGSAIATGCVDLVLPLPEIGATLVRLAGRAARAGEFSHGK